MNLKKIGQTINHYRWVLPLVLIVFAFAFAFYIDYKTKNRVENFLSKENGDIMMLLEPEDDGGFSAIYIDKKTDKRTSLHLPRSMAKCLPTDKHTVAIKLTNKQIVCMGENVPPNQRLQCSCPCPCKETAQNTYSP